MRLSDEARAQVIYTSGYAKELLCKSGVNYGPIIEKPCDRSVWQRILRLLD